MFEKSFCKARYADCKIIFQTGSCISKNYKACKIPQMCLLYDNVGFAVNFQYRNLWKEAYCTESFSDCVAATGTAP